MVFEKTLQRMSKQDFTVQILKRQTGKNEKSNSTNEK